jgi:hypothetical protein
MQIFFNLAVNLNKSILAYRFSIKSIDCSIFRTVNVVSRGEPEEKPRGRRRDTFGRFRSLGPPLIIPRHRVGEGGDGPISAAIFLPGRSESLPIERLSESLNN